VPGGRPRLLTGADYESGDASDSTLLGSIGAFGQQHGKSDNGSKVRSRLS
jgi:hypothetical protein